MNIKCNATGTKYIWTLLFIPNLKCTKKVQMQLIIKAPITNRYQQYQD